MFSASKPFKLNSLSLSYFKLISVEIYTILEPIFVIWCLRNALLPPVWTTNIRDWALFCLAQQRWLGIVPLPNLRFKNLQPFLIKPLISFLPLLGEQFPALAFPCSKACIGHWKQEIRSCLSVISASYSTFNSRHCLIKVTSVGFHLSNLLPEWKHVRAWQDRLVCLINL